LRRNLHPAALPPIEPPTFIGRAIFQLLRRSGLRLASESAPSGTADEERPVFTGCRILSHRWRPASDFRQSPDLPVSPSNQLSACTEYCIFRLHWPTNLDSHGILILRHVRRLTSGLRRMISRPARPVMNSPTFIGSFIAGQAYDELRFQPDLASSDEPPMSIQPPPYIASPDAPAISFRLSPSAQLASAASNQPPACADY